MAKRECKHCPTMILYAPGQTMCRPCKKAYNSKYYQSHKEESEGYRDKYGSEEIIKEDLDGGSHITGGIFKGCSDIQRLAMETGNVELLLRS